VLETVPAPRFLRLRELDSEDIELDVNRMTFYYPL